MSEFKLAHIKKEGAACHPDHFDNACDMPAEWYMKQMAAYVDATGDTDAPKHCVRNELFA